MVLVFFFAVERLSTGALGDCLSAEAAGAARLEDARVPFPAACLAAGLVLDPAATLEFEAAAFVVRRFVRLEEVDFAAEAGFRVVDFEVRVRRAGFSEEVVLAVLGTGREASKGQYTKRGSQRMLATAENENIALNRSLKNRLLIL